MNEGYGYFKDLIDDSDYEEMFTVVTPIQKLMEVLEKNEIEKEKKEYYDNAFFSFFIFDRPFYNTEYIKTNMKQFINVESKRKLKPLINFINRHFNSKKFLLYPINSFVQYKIQTVGDRKFVIIKYPLSERKCCMKYYEVKAIKVIDMNLDTLIYSMCDEFNKTLTKNHQKVEYLLTLKEI